MLNRYFFAVEINAFIYFKSILDARLVSPSDIQDIKSAYDFPTTIALRFASLANELFINQKILISIENNLLGESVSARNVFCCLSVHVHFFFLAWFRFLELAKRRFLLWNKKLEKKCKRFVWPELCQWIKQIIENVWSGFCCWSFFIFTLYRV